MRVQLEIAVRRVDTIWTGTKKQGDIVWVDEKAARQLLENGICRFIDWDKPAPDEVAQVPKSAGAVTAGHLIDLRSLKESGPGVSSASAAALVLPKRV